MEGIERPKIRADSRLIALAKIYEERNAIYGDNYKEFGKVMQALFFGQPIYLKTIEDQNRFALLVQIVSKISRYCSQFDHGGHADSLDDLAVYAMLLQEVDHDVPRN